MIFAFARDGGFPASNCCVKVSPTLPHAGQCDLGRRRARLHLDPLQRRSSATLASGCAVFLYLSYAMPIGAGMLAEGKTWTKKGPFNLGGLSKPFAVIAVLGGLLLFFIGVQPPNEQR